MKRIVFLLLMMRSAVFSFSQIQGDITDPKDKGIAGASIAIMDSTGKMLSTVKSDTRGFYSFSDLKPGKYRIEVKVGGFQPATLENITIKEEDTGILDGDIYHGQRLDIILTPAKSP